MQPQSTRRFDSKQEYIINSFLNQFYFKKVNPSTKIVKDTELQIAGVDFRQKNKFGQIINIDVKAQSSARYINNPQPTYILELSSLNKYDEPFIGWFLNEELITDYYCFVWIPEADTDHDGRLKNMYDIKKAEVMTVSKAKLHEYIMPLLRAVDLDRTIRLMRDTELTRKPLTSELHFSHTPNLREKPVNLVAKKSLLKKFAVEHCVVTQEGISFL